MAKQEPQKLDTNSKDIMSENLEKLKKLFPTVVKDGTVDVEALRNVIGNISEPNQEYYNFTWAGKSEAFKVIKEKTTATLKPLTSDDESVDFDNTQNIFIEGDNLEVLKLLQKTYHNTIKMIYIDPPYNKDKDFVYPDKWNEGLTSYLEYSKLADKEGNITSSKAEDKAVKSGRKHSRWLTMMYPRLFLARNLLKDDGVIVIHIDENENENLHMICKEIFGEENNLGTFIWDKGNPKGDSKAVATQHETIIAFAKNIESFKEHNEFKRAKKNAQKMLNKAKQLFKKLGKKVLPDDIKECIKTYSLDIDVNELQLTYRLEDINNEFQKWLNKQNFSNGEKAYKYIDSKGNVYRGVSMAWPNKKKAPDDYCIPLIHPITKKPCPLPEKGWRNPSETMKLLLEKDLILFGTDETKQPERKYLLKENMDENIPSVLFYGGSDDAFFKEEKLSFDNPKPYNFSKELISYFTNNDDIIIDFFAGSGTTAHSIMALNSDDGGNRKCISIQLPEQIDKKDEAYNQGYKKISEITKERIRKAGKKIKDENPDSGVDTGFKVFTLSESNFKQWDDTPKSKEELQLAFEEYKDNVKEGSNQLDMLYEVILAKGLSLNSKVQEIEVGSKKMFKVDSDGVELLACFEDEITEGALDEVIELRPIYFICLDSSFKSGSALKTNSVLRFRDADILFETV